MSNKDNEYKSSSLWQLILVIAGTILAFTLLIALLAKSFSGATPEAVDTAAVAKVEANIKPVAQVEVAKMCIRDSYRYLFGLPRTLACL